MMFLIMTHLGLEGVRLSRPGHFGNVPFPTDADATAEARRIANGSPIAIERKAAGRIR